MLSLIKSILKSLELFLALKNKQFYYDLQKEHKRVEDEIIKKIEYLRRSGISNNADRADLLRERLIAERSRFKHLSAFYSKTAERESDPD
jgi:hypothetical protein|tara:strand:- start:1777 stop:2046 length:270 start_codon:yes stop_codon:yes gene_type:complete